MTTQSKYMKTHEGMLDLKDGAWVGIPDSFFEVRGAGIQGLVSYTMCHGYTDDPMKWTHLKVSWGADRADGMEVRTVVGPQDRQPGAILADVSQYRIGVITVRYSFETPPGEPEQPFRKLYGAPEPAVKSFIGGYAPALPGTSGWAEDDGDDPDDDLSLEEWLAKHGDTLGDAATKWEADDELTGEEALDAWLARHAAAEDGEGEPEPKEPPVSRHAKGKDGYPLWMQILEEEGADISDLRKQWKETGGTWHGSHG